ncbi:universal stress protein [Adhaeribacter terreus]|uniref:Universal stress protein n=1 Tax=Adhaeribacter terreus TaxID=529703 RepID=A0ABW0EDB1_9BACT
MNIIKRVMVGLDFTPMDDSEIAYAAFLSSLSAVEKVCFVHVEKHLELPEELKLPQEDLSVKETLTRELQQKVDIAFKSQPQVVTEIRIKEGSEVKEMLKVAKEEDIDLIIVGRKMQLKGSGVLPKKLLRASRRSVLFVPENTEVKLKKIVVSIDFNEYSMMALDRMLHSALALSEFEIECLHVYQVPPGYVTLGQTYEAFDQRMQENARAKFSRVLQQFPELEDRASLKLVKKHHDEDIGEVIVLEAKRSRADLLVIGAAGKSAAALFMLGSVTEKILHYDNDIPLLVFKRENEAVGFIDALLRDE